MVALKAEGGRKAVLTKELSTLTQVTKVVSLDGERLKRDLKARAADVKNLLSNQTPQARQMLRKLLVDRLDFAPVE